MKTRNLIIGCLLLLTAPAHSGNVKLMNDKALFPAENIASKRRMHPLFAARLNPTGTHLLYSQMVPASPPEYQTRFEMVAYELASGQENVIPVHLPSGYESVYTRFNFFNPAGDTLAMGRYQAGEQQTDLILYDLKRKKTISTGIKGRSIQAMFDHTGNILYGLGRAKIDLSDFTSRRTPIPDWTHTPSPFSPYATVFATIRQQDQNRPRYSFQLWNLETETLLKELPVHEKNSGLDDISAQWTQNGRYVYYLDLSQETEENERTLLTRVWDVTSNSQLEQVMGKQAVGPGPTKSTMVMVAHDDQQQNRIFLHDAQSNECVEIAPRTAKAIHACGKKLLYVFQDMVYIADIAMSE